MIKVYIAIARAIGAYQRCSKESNPWENFWYERLKAYERSLYGAGIEDILIGTAMSKSDSLIVVTGRYHALSENGFYDGYYDFTVKITPSLATGCCIRVTGNMGKYNDAKDFIFDMFSETLWMDVEEYPAPKGSVLTAADVTH